MKCSFAISFLLAFLCGSIPTAFLAGKWLKGIDIREHGSGNVGATNAFRVFGKKIGALVFALDLLKGYLPAYFLARFCFEAKPEWVLWIGLGAVLGHIFTPFLGFKGGKGIATGSGILLASYPALFGATFLSWILVFLLTRIVSLSSLVAISVLLAMAIFLKLPQASQAFFLLMFVTLFWTHRSNIARLLKGEEKALVNRKKI